MFRKKVLEKQLLRLAPSILMFKLADLSALVAAPIDIPFTFGTTVETLTSFSAVYRNIVAPAYRFVGRFVAQPIHRLVTRGKDASPYRNNVYHRMIARREYFQDIANGWHKD